MENWSGVTLVLGGARSGKSVLAERIALGWDEAVTYLAAGPSGELDPAWAERIARHRSRRPFGWRTIEVGPGEDLAGPLRSEPGHVLLDALGPWAAGLMEGPFDEEIVAGLCEALEQRRVRGAATVVVSDEVGMGVHPVTEIGRQFRDRLGVINHAVADLADEVVLVVAGRPLRLQGLDDLGLGPADRFPPTTKRSGLRR